MHTTRRQFLAIGAASLVAAHRVAWAEPAGTNPLAGKIGITMSSVQRLENSVSMLEWPKILREELDLTVIDLNSGMIESHEPDYLERVRRAADDAGCVLTNMKINRRDVDIGNADPQVRTQAVAECKRWIDTSSRLGLRWARPLPLKTPPDLPGYIAAYRELADYAAERNVQMVVENYGWMGTDAEAVGRLLEAVNRDAETGLRTVATAPDTGNWADNDIRYAGLAKVFPVAVTCDFKAGKLGPDGEHPTYDLKRCFDIGWDAGFRGPWCLEHAHADRQTLFRELALVRDMLRDWIAERN